jgi:cardiolipin synthase
MVTPPTPLAPRSVRGLRPLQRRTLPRSLHADRAWAFARTLPHGVRDPAFRALVQRIDGSPWHALAQVAVFEDGADSFAAILDAVHGATFEVVLETYILRDDRIGDRLREALTAAAACGVRVAVLADALGSLRTSREYWRALEAAGIRVRLFHPWWHSPLHAWRRDHRKIVVVDRAIAFVGGMNIGEEYGSALGAHGDVFRDTFACVTGPVAEELVAVFAEEWTRASGERLPGVRPVARVARHTTHDTAHEAARDPAPDTARETPQDAAADAVLILDSHPGRGQPETIAVLAALVGAARERLWITTPYFAPPDGGLHILIDAARRGVDVRVLLPGRSDVPLLRHAAHGAYARLLRGGVRVFEYQPRILHAKTMVCDGALGVLGSANLDFRSLWFNAECNLLVAHDSTAEALEAQFLADQAQAIEITRQAWRERSWWHVLGDTLARSLRVLL